MPPRQGSPKGALPTKLYFRIGEVAEALGVEPHVLRYWETEFRSIRPQKSSRGQRVYARRDVEHLQRIRELLYDRGFTIAGAKRHLRDGGQEPREASDPASLDSVRLRSALTGLRDNLRALLAELPPDTPPPRSSRGGLGALLAGDSAEVESEQAPGGAQIGETQKGMSSPPEP